VGGGREVGKIEGETTGDEVRRDGKRSAAHLTGVFLWSGYTRNGRGCKEKLETLGKSLAYSLVAVLSKVGLENNNSPAIRWRGF
jgi:hypothetical protein